MNTGMAPCQRTHNRTCTSDYKGHNPWDTVQHSRLHLIQKMRKNKVWQDRLQSNTIFLLVNKYFLCFFAIKLGLSSTCAHFVICYKHSSLSSTIRSRPYKTFFSSLTKIFSIFFLLSQVILLAMIFSICNKHSN